jgi:hypothetical protein
VRWFSPVVAFLMVAGCAQWRDVATFRSALQDRFGKVEIKTVMAGDSSSNRIELLFTDTRWRQPNIDVPDSAQVVARYALDHLAKGMVRPDTIIVQFRDHQGVSSTGTSSVVVEVGEL